MKKFFLVLFAGILFIGCNNEKKVETAKNTDLIQQNLKGKVQHYDETSYTVDSAGKMGAMDSITNSQDFDEKGYQTKFAGKNSKGEVQTEGMVTHYDNGQTKEFESKNKGKLAFKMVIELDSNGKYSRADAYDSTGKIASYYKDLAENEYGEVLKGTEYKLDNTM